MVFSLLWSPPLPSSPIPFIISLTLQSFFFTSFGKSARDVIYHQGPLLSGNLSLVVLWYGQHGAYQHFAIRHLVESINTQSDSDPDSNSEWEPMPTVSSWWKKVESYEQLEGESDASKRPRIGVQITKEIYDKDYSMGKNLTIEALHHLIEKNAANGGSSSNTIMVVLTDADVAVANTCYHQRTCYLHGDMGTNKQLYIVVGNPVQQCAGVCATPFHRSILVRQAVTLQPPSGNMAADSMVIHFASALAATVTNPYNTGFFGDDPIVDLEVATACHGVFAPGAFPGYTGKVRIDPMTGGAFNARGNGGIRFLLPGLWNSKGSNCWTTLGETFAFSVLEE